MIRTLTIAVTAIVAVMWARRGGVRHVAVTGTSMQPTLCPGDRLILLRAPGAPRAGRLVVAPDPRAPTRELLKRVHAVDGCGLDVRGDNPVGSTDSRTFGQVPVGTARTYLAWRYAPAARVGVVV